MAKTCAICLRALRHHVIHYKRQRYFLESWFQNGLTISRNFYCRKLWDITIKKFLFKKKKANFFFQEKKSFDFTKDNYYYLHFLLKNDNVHQCKPIIFFWDSISKRDECGQKVLHTVLDTVVDVDFVDFFIFAKKKNGRTSFWRIISSLSDMIS